MSTEKTQYALNLLESAFINTKPRGVGCSFGKDSVTAVHLARRIDPNIPVFSIMTIFKPKETFEYLVEINRLLNLDVLVYMVAERVPQILIDNGIKVELLSPDNFREAQGTHENFLHTEDVDRCCHLLKVVPIQKAVANYDVLIDGLRSSEGITRQNLQEIEITGDLTKIHPILHFTEEDIFEYLKKNDIPIHPWYLKTFPDGKRYRSLGCAPCTRPIFDHESERDGRWQGSKKEGGECGIHTNQIKPSKQNIPLQKTFVMEKQDYNC
ncbi:Phosphoadenosine phosphosulfate reductase [Candidatus Lokiarchaeum ossiferum]|uniref:Phosphoadenosine phosphosulfate reductase n=1 Tax=Candidatus Lokiarchaeum ossiferum TaxID=2951803 RepID=A0ABY6HQT2_9ARCH|nr:Phosphoadenosine phosphosulfate reductase [Candidatus Lokiarchaeum sp. B-35]